ncbi:hypothetical protein RHODGE_RHODGE_01030 [Rhodoplanes serenus]|uniref:DUF3168 domain-containing protein n=2 Tax=Nitrobacteraceae TaxID=41294 RepID=A0A3S4AXI0_9BRAD|nr:phage tail terminator-like protein [Rhodoplanes serenus]VCU06577.1 hypothetical protein RHODPL_RHODPL_00025 [Rhodoplanes serenus]VCU07880.1 hypothetical protein RHODGE_RHODGE_01030 [Rhodoplanes serenus]
MANHPETIIGLALFDRLRTMPGVLPIAWPNVPFTPPDDQRYLRVYVLPGQPEGIDLSGRHIRRGGMLQVSVCWPAGAGITAPREVAGAIADRFALGTIIERGGLRIRISRPPRIAGELIEDVVVQVPITAHYDVLS